MVEEGAWMVGGGYGVRVDGRIRLDWHVMLIGKGVYMGSRGESEEKRSLKWREIRKVIEEKKNNIQTHICGLYKEHKDI